MKIIPDHTIGSLNMSHIWVGLFGRWTNFKQTPTASPYHVACHSQAKMQELGSHNDILRSLVQDLEKQQAQNLQQLKQQQQQQHDAQQARDSEAQTSARGWGGEELDRLGAEVRYMSRDA